MMPSKEIKAGFLKSLEHFRHDLAQIRTGRANPAMLEGILVEYYGTPTPLQQVAGINAPEPMLLTVQVWDSNALQAAEKAIRSSGLGLNPVVDGQLIRVPFPPLSEERRNELVKLARQKAEAARVSVRAVREEQMRALKKTEEDGKLSEDAAELQKKDIQKQVENANETIQAVIEQKEREILHL